MSFYSFNKLIYIFSFIKVSLSTNYVRLQAFYEFTLHVIHHGPMETGACLLRYVIFSGTVSYVSDLKWGRVFICVNKLNIYKYTSQKWEKCYLKMVEKQTLRRN